VLLLIEEAKYSAPGLVNLLAEYFPSFRDECRFEGRKIRFLKRAQIFVADLWAAFEGEGWGRFNDIDKITMFAGKKPCLKSERDLRTNSQNSDYRIPQILHTLGCMLFSPPLERDIRKKVAIKSGSTWEIELRGGNLNLLHFLSLIADEF
jgi:hypothetical protein